MRTLVVLYILLVVITVSVASLVANTETAYVKLCKTQMVINWSVPIAIPTVDGSDPVIAICVNGFPELLLTPIFVNTSLEDTQLIGFNAPWVKSIWNYTKCGESCLIVRGTYKDVDMYWRINLNVSGDGLIAVDIYATANNTELIIPLAFFKTPNLKEYRLVDDTLVIRLNNTTIIVSGTMKFRDDPLVPWLTSTSLTTYHGVYHIRFVKDSIDEVIHALKLVGSKEVVVSDDKIVIVDISFPAIIVSIAATTIAITWGLIKKWRGGE